MRGLILIVLFFLISCSSSKKRKITSCKNEAFKKLQEASKVLSPLENRMYNLNFEVIDLPLEYDTMTWVNNFGKKIEYSLNSKKDIYYSRLLESVVSTNCNPAIKKEDVLKYYGKPSRDNAYIKTFTYCFNTKAKPDCYDSNEKGILRYKGCSELYFIFDNNDILTKIETSMFHP